MRVHHLALRTRDLLRLVRFYEVLGLPRVREQAGHSVWLDLEGALLMIERAADGEAMLPDGSRELLALTLPPGGRPALEATLARLGVAIEGRTEHTTYFRDPDGRRVGCSDHPILRRVRVVGELVRAPDGRVLVAQRKPGGPHGGLWEFPGGKVEPGERPEDALARELREELACASQVGARFESVEQDYPDFHISLEVYEVELLGEPVAIGVGAIDWVAPRQLVERRFPPADEPIVRRLVAER